MDVFRTQMEMSPLTANLQRRIIPSNSRPTSNMVGVEAVDMHQGVKFICCCFFLCFVFPFHFQRWWHFWGKEQAAKEAADAEVQALQFLGLHGWWTLTLLELCRSTLLTQSMGLVGGVRLLINTLFNLKSLSFLPACFPHTYVYIYICSSLWCVCVGLGRIISSEKNPCFGTLNSSFPNMSKGFLLPNQPDPFTHLPCWSETWPRTAWNSGPNLNSNKPQQSKKDRRWKAQKRC